MWLHNPLARLIKWDIIHVLDALGSCWYRTWNDYSCPHQQNCRLWIQTALPAAQQLTVEQLILLCLLLLTPGPPGLESFFGLVHQKWLSKWLRMEVFSTSVVMLHKLRQNERWGVCPYMRGNLNKVCFLFKEVWRVVPQTAFWKEVGKWSDFLKTAHFFFFFKVNETCY